MTQTTAPSSPPARRGFTLVEVLVAISILILLMALALPAFRAITGSRSVEGATNQVTAMLGRARTDAIAAAIPHGVAFFVDATGQARMAEVAPVTFATWTNGNVNTPYSQGQYVAYQVNATTTVYYVCIAPQPAAANVDLSNLPITTSTNPVAAKYWHQFGVAADGTLLPYEPIWASAWNTTIPVLYDQILETDAVPLPLGVGSQVIADSSASKTVPERYLRDGSVMFDGSGRLAYLSTVFSKSGLVGTQAGLDLKNAAASTSGTIAQQASQQLLPSSFGLVLYERDAYAAQNFPPADPTLNVAYTYAAANGTNTEGDAEAWLDANATPLLINRYTGSLVRGE